MKVLRRIILMLALLATPLLTESQTTGPMYRIGTLATSPPTTPTVARIRGVFIARLAELARLLTNPFSTNEPATGETIGIVPVACIAARVAGVPNVTITSTGTRTKSVASAGNRSGWFPAKRYSMTKSRPSTYARSRRP